MKVKKKKIKIKPSSNLCLSDMHILSIEIYVACMPLKHKPMIPKLDHLLLNKKDFHSIFNISVPIIEVIPS